MEGASAGRNRCMEKHRLRDKRWGLDENITTTTKSNSFTVASHKHHCHNKRDHGLEENEMRQEQKPWQRRQHPDQTWNVLFEIGNRDCRRSVV